jgi:hypothetical protein
MMFSLLSDAAMSGGRSRGRKRDGKSRLGDGGVARGASVEHPVAVLSDNSIEHGLLTLAAMHVGIPSRRFRLRTR